MRVQAFLLMVTLPSWRIAFSALVWQNQLFLTLLDSSGKPPILIAGL